MRFSQLAITPVKDKAAVELWQKWGATLRQLYWTRRRTNVLHSAISFRDTRQNPVRE
jgi:hypothetical protein